MTKDKTKTHNIDAVILWVNGNDDKHKIKISKYVDNKNDISFVKLIKVHYLLNFETV